MPRAKKAAAMPQGKCMCTEPNKLGMFFGTFLALAHLGWALLVASGYAQMLYDWILQLHMLSIPVTVLPFDPVMAVELILVTFIIGYVMGFVLALVWNKVGKCNCCM